MAPSLFEASRFGKNHSTSSSLSAAVSTATTRSKHFRGFRSKMATPGGSSGTNTTNPESSSSSFSSSASSSSSSPMSIVTSMMSNMNTSPDRSGYVKPASLGLFEAELMERDQKELGYEVVEDTIRVQRRLECTVYKTNVPSSRHLNPLHLSWRRKILDWMYAICQYCKLAPNAVGAAAHYFDVAAQHGLLKELPDYQVGGVTCLYLALKLFDSPLNRVVRLDSLVQLGNGKFETRDVLVMEAKIIGALNWRLHPPTAQCFVELFAQLLDCGDDKEQTEKVANSLITSATPIVQAAIVEERFQSERRRPSVVAYAAMVMAVESATANFELSYSETQRFLSNLSRYAKIDSRSPGVEMASRALHEMIQPAVPYTPPPSSVPKASPISPNRSDSMSSVDTVRTTNSIMPRVSAVMGSAGCRSRGLSSLVRNLTSKLSTSSSAMSSANESPNSIVDGPYQGSTAR